MGIILLLLSFCAGEELCRETFPNCKCTYTSVVCVGESLRDVNTLFTTYPSLRETVARLEIHGSTFLNISEQFFCDNPNRDPLSSLIYLDLSSNNITEVYSTTFECTPNVETLILANNQWQVARNDTELGVGFFDSMSKLKHLDLARSLLYVFNGTVYVSKISKLFYNANLNFLTDLNITYNELNSLSTYSANKFCGLTVLERLNISHNNLSEPAMPDKKECFQNIKVLDFSANKMENLRGQFMDNIERVFNNYGRLENVFLNDNPFVCDCWLKATWYWLNATKVPVNKHQLKCTSRENPSLKDGETFFITDVNPDDLNCRGGLQLSHMLIKIIAGVIFAIIGITIVICMISKRGKILELCKREDGRGRYSQQEQLC